MLLTGDPIDSAEALRCALVSRLVAPSGLLSAAMTLVPHRRVPSADRGADGQGRPTRQREAWDWKGAIQYEREMQTIRMGNQDAAEGRLPFAEKRPPIFQGR